MKYRPLRPWESRLLAIALALLAVLLAYLLLLHWWFVAPQWRMQAAMADLRETQSRYAAAIAEKSSWERRLARLDQGQAANQAFLPESDPNAAAADLMQRVVDAVAAHPAQGRCEVTQKMPVLNPPTAPHEPYRKVAVTISLRCAIRPLAGLLYTLEQGTPYLFIEDFSISRSYGEERTSTPTLLDVGFTLSGYMHQPNPPAQGNAS